MNKKVKEKWLKALRSRKYSQCKGQLREEDDNGNTYCCLGVLCDIYNPKGWGKEFHNSDTNLPQKVVKWAGLESDDPVLSAKEANNPDAEEYAGCASYLNDTKGKKFHEIAKFIERNL